jgi:flavodoxin I
MAKIGIIFGSSTGNTENAAYIMKEKLGDDAAIHNIGETTPEQMLQYQYLLLGIPTWNTGQLQDDWEIFFPKLVSMDFSGKKVAIFGLGDQNGYGFNFLDAVGMLADEVLIQNGDLQGYWSTANYEFEESLAQDGNHFMGLGIDIEGQAEMSEDRINNWLAQVKKEFGLS